jgi:ATP-dependent Lhr-like helicase
VSPFERLDPLVQHHIVNTLGWRDLRPLQESSIEPVLRGDDCLLLAPTAGGKTEAAIFPLLSRMCSEQWASPSIIYVCPLKALINNLGERLDRYTRMIGRRSAIWHGDIGQAGRNQTRTDPPDILLTTPESLEGMLISTNPQMKTHLSHLRAVVVDEIHAFAGDDRGWHLLCVLERLNARVGHELQRIGLSATVGNPEQLLQWLSAGSSKSQTVVQPPAETGLGTEVILDFVGNLENAATVISRLHRGEKRLVFCDSRSRVEKLAGLLKSSGIQAFVSHSSLSASERRRAEDAFAHGDDCVIVATSTLELGIDVGDLDRVIQIDAPVRVASFLQRLGRTGRRLGKARNCLFLGTNDDALLRGAALLHLWENGYVEPIVPPALPYHILAQQAMALCLEKSGLGRRDLFAQLQRLPPGKEMAEATIAAILDHMVANRLLATDEVRYFVGEEGENAFGHRNFIELVSVFTSAPVLTVTDGRQDLGMVDQNLFFSGTPAEGRLISLAGRGWRVMRVDWKERRVYVMATDLIGKSTWLGASAGLSLKMCRAIREILQSEKVSAIWSQRAASRLSELRDKFNFLKSDRTTIAHGSDGKMCWYTFAGEPLNLALADVLKKQGMESEKTDDYGVYFSDGSRREALESLLLRLTAAEVIASMGSNPEAEQALKFHECLPSSLSCAEVVARRCQESDLAIVLSEPRYFFVMARTDKCVGIDTH